VIELAMMRLGAGLAWLILGLALLSSAVLVLRYGFGIGSVALQESVLYLNAILVLLGISVTLLGNAHVRVDVVSCHWSVEAQALRDVLGSIFLLLPMIVAIGWFGWDYVARSWAIHEGSGDAGGLAGVYWIKSFILVGDGLLLLAGVAFAWRSWQVWRGQAPALLVESQHEL
jgi:TRAP-type mannitol/chloroaromatic compound transport system permease small subunit